MTHTRRLRFFLTGDQVLSEPARIVWVKRWTSAPRRPARGRRNTEIGRARRTLRGAEPPPLVYLRRAAVLLNGRAARRYDERRGLGSAQRLLD